MKPSTTLSRLCVPLLLAPSMAVMAQTEIGNGFSISGNATIINDYRFRGYTQTNFQPAIQVGVDLTHTSGFYLGNWNSNVASSLFPGGNIEMDFYGGWKKEIGHGVTFDVGVLQYTYPGSDASGTGSGGGPYANTDLYVGLGYGPFTFKYSYTPTNFFRAPNSAGTMYFDAGANFDLGDGWGIQAHLGWQTLKNQVNANGDPINGYLDYKLGVTKNLSGWVLGVAMVGATANNWYQTNNGLNAGRIGVLASVNRAF